MDSVGQGSVEAGFTPALFYYGKDPTLAFGTAVPFGPSSRQMWSWLHQGGGREQLRDVYADQGSGPSRPPAPGRRWAAGSAARSARSRT
ncbi:hypothetical protein ACFQY5_12230 [Paeniroseomonas aquatica]|uniref:hypothetical protein n=1 Tax=Paeniroseomonas aquatica TaxID=373043 RepID=UPI00360D25FD